MRKEKPGSRRVGGGVGRRETEMSHRESAKALAWVRKASTHPHVPFSLSLAVSKWKMEPLRAGALWTDALPPRGDSSCRTSPRGASPSSTEAIRTSKCRRNRCRGTLRSLAKGKHSNKRGKNKYNTIRFAYDRLFIVFSKNRSKESSCAFHVVFRAPALNCFFFCPSGHSRRIVYFERLRP